MHIQKYRRNEFVPLMIELIHLYHPKTYVEIGVAEGYTFNKIIANCPEIQTAVAVDIKPMPNVPMGSYKVSEVQKFEMASQDFAKTWNKPIDMLFIDGDHDRDVLHDDFMNIGKFVRPGTGLILMHDTHPMMEYLLQPEFCNNAWEFADWLHREAGPEYEVITLCQPWAGISLVRKIGNHHLCWR